MYSILLRRAPGYGLQLKASSSRLTDQLNVLHAFMKDPFLRTSGSTFSLHFSQSKIFFHGEDHSSLELKHVAINRHSGSKYFTDSVASCTNNVPSTCLSKRTLFKARSDQCFTHRQFSSSASWHSQSKRPVKSSFPKLKLPSVKSLNRFVAKGRLTNSTKHNLSGRITSMRHSLSTQNEHLKNSLRKQRRKSAEAVRRMQKNMVSSTKENIKTIPNLLTTLRMSSAPLLAYLVVNEYFVPAFSIFVLAGFTDMLDGYIARNFKNQRTALGTALDPLADKLLMSFLTVSLTYAGLVPAPLTALILGRDAGLIAGSFYIRFISLSPPRTLARYFDVSHVTAKLYPSTISKVNTLLQLSYVALTLAAPVFDFVDSPWLAALMYTTALTTFMSGADYVLTWRRRLKIVKND